MTLSLRERRRLLLHDEILYAARSLINEKGYVNMSMDDLAARAGISKPTLYSFFATKEDLVVAAFVKAADSLFAVVESQHGQQTPLNLIVYVLAAMLQTDDGDLPIVSQPLSSDLFHVLCLHPQAVQIMQRMEKLVASLFRDAIEQDEVSADLNPEALAVMFFGLVHSVRMTSFMSIFTLDTKELHQTLIRFLLRAVKSHREA